MLAKKPLIHCWQFLFLYDMSKIREKGPGHTLFAREVGTFTGQDKSPGAVKV